MSGWFDGSGDGTNDAFYGIAAGHRGRRHHQKMRRQPMQRFGIIKPDPDPVKTSMYKEFVIKCREIGPFAGWKCTATLNQGLTYKTFESKAKSSAEANNKIKDMIDLYWEKQEPDPKPPADLPFLPVSLPNDFIAGQYTVRAIYSGASTQYIVTVFSGNVSLQSESYTQHNGAAAINKFNTFTSLVTKKAKYDLEVSKTDTKGNYNIDLQVIVQKGGSALVNDTLGGFFSGMMNMFGLGGGHDAVVKQRMAEKHRNLSLTAQETPNMLPTAMQGRTHSMYTKNYNTIGSGLGESHGTSWSSMPAKKFQVVVSRMGEGTVVKKYPETGDYGIAVENYETELLTIANDPTFYDEPVQKPPTDPPGNGGGDLTDPTIYWINLDGTVGTGPRSQMPDGSKEITYEQYQEILDAPKPGDDPPGAIVLTQPTSTYQTQTLTENQWVMNQQSARENAVAMDSNNANLLLGAAALAGAIYLARK